MFNEQGSRIRKMLRTDNPDNDLVGEFLTLFAYCKNYEGQSFKGKKSSDPYRFYDEREWRYVPTSSGLNGEPSWIPGDSYIKDKQGLNNKIKDCYLKFTHSDISYLIVNTEKEIPKILKTLNEVFDPLVTPEELKILSTKIITKNQIY